MGVRSASRTIMAVPSSAVGHKTSDRHDELNWCLCPCGLASHNIRRWWCLFALIHNCALLQEDSDLIFSLHKQWAILRAKDSIRGEVAQSGTNGEDDDG